MFYKNSRFVFYLLIFSFFLSFFSFFLFFLFFLFFSKFLLLKKIERFTFDLPLPWIYRGRPLYSKARNLCRIFEPEHPVGAPRRGTPRPPLPLPWVHSKRPLYSKARTFGEFWMWDGAPDRCPRLRKFSQSTPQFFFPASEPYGLRYEEEKRNFLFSFSSTSTDAAVRVFFFAGYSAKFSPRARGTPPGHPSPACAAPLSV